MTGERLHVHLEGPPFTLAVAAGERVLLAGDTGRVVRACLGRGDGAVRVDGHVLHGAIDARVRAGLGLAGDSTVAADVSILDHLAPRVGARAATRLLANSILAGRGDQPAGVLSGGERAVLGWLRCEATSPRAVLLDGAGAGMDGDALAWAAATVERWTAAGVAVLVVPGRPEEAAWAPGPAVSVP